MPVPKSHNNLRGAFRRSYAKLASEGKVAKGLPLMSPGRQIRRTDGWTLVRHPVAPGGTPIDASEALRQCASKPWAVHARYLGVARSFHLFEYDPRRLGTKATASDGSELVARMAPYQPAGPDALKKRR